jgi:protein required for attachment to host cells
MTIRYLREAGSDAATQAPQTQAAAQQNAERKRAKRQKEASEDTVNRCQIERQWVHPDPHTDQEKGAHDGGIASKKRRGVQRRTH